MKNNEEKREKPDGAEGEILLDPLMVFLMVIGEPENFVITLSK